MKKKEEKNTIKETKRSRTPDTIYKKKNLNNKNKNQNSIKKSNNQNINLKTEVGKKNNKIIKDLERAKSYVNLKKKKY